MLFGLFKFSVFCAYELRETKCYYITKGGIRYSKKNIPKNLMILQTDRTIEVIREYVQDVNNDYERLLKERDRLLDSARNLSSTLGEDQYRQALVCYKTSYNFLTKIISQEVSNASI